MLRQILQKPLQATLVCIAMFFPNGKIYVLIYARNYEVEGSQRGRNGEKTHKKKNPVGQLTRSQTVKDK